MHHFFSIHILVASILFLGTVTAILLLFTMLEAFVSESSCDRFMVDVEAGKHVLID